MTKLRQVVYFEHHFEDFSIVVPDKVRVKIRRLIEILEFQKRVPTEYLKYLEGTDGLYEARIQFGSNIWRIFCFFDGKLIVFLNAFQKKTPKTPRLEIEKAIKLKRAYEQERAK